MSAAERQRLHRARAPRNETVSARVERLPEEAALVRRTSHALMDAITRGEVTAQDLRNGAWAVLKEIADDPCVDPRTRVQAAGIMAQLSAAAERYAAEHPTALLVDSHIEPERSPEQLRADLASAIAIHQMAERKAS